MLAAHSPEATGPKRISLPSMLPPGWLAVTVWVIPARLSCGLPCDSKPTATAPPMASRVNITPKITHPNRLPLTITPRAKVDANGIRIVARSSSRSVNPLGFSNGWAELVLKNPPPLVPICLIEIWLATGPPEIFWVSDDRVRRLSGDRGDGAGGVEVVDRRPGSRARSRTRTTAGAGCGRCCGSGRPRSCRSCGTGAGPAPG